jgi:hypothetical protein
MANKTRKRTRRWRACGVEGSGTCKDNGHGSMASSQTTAGHTAARRGQETTAGTQGPTRAHKAPASLARRPNATTRGGWRGSPPIQRSSGKTAAKKVRWSRGRRLGRLGLMQGRAARRRLQQVWLLFRGGDLTTDGSGLGVDVLGSGYSGFAAPTHGRTATRSCGFSLLHERHSPSDSSSSLLPPPLLF